MKTTLHSMKNKFNKFLTKLFKFSKRTESLFIVITCIAISIAAIKFIAMQNENNLTQKTIENYKFIEKQSNEIKSKLLNMDKYIFILHIHLNNYISNGNRANHNALVSHILDREGQFSNSDSASNVSMQSIFDNSTYESYINCSQIYLDIRKMSLKIINNNILNENLTQQEYNILIKFLDMLKNKHIEHNECFKNVHDGLNTTLNNFFIN